MDTPKTPLGDGEQIVRESRANLQRGAETVGGHAWLTSARLIFEPHKLNVQSDPISVDVGDIRGATGGFTKFLGVLPLVPNAVVIQTASDELRLTVTGRKGWIGDLEAAAGGTGR